MSRFNINTMTEAKFLELSSKSKLLSTELNIVDDDNINRTSVPSYDLLKSYVHQLSTALKDIEIKDISKTSIGDMYENIKNIKQKFGTEY